MLYVTSQAAGDRRLAMNVVFRQGVGVDRAQVLRQNRIARLDGVGDVQVFGARDYAIRVWLDPAKVAARGLTAGEVLEALQRATIQDRRDLDNNVLVQVGLVVLIGLEAKNAILIVEFARHAEEEGMTRWQAAEAAARTRLRPILMASLAFILGVLPLAVATGPGAEMRQSLGTAVLAGMLGVTAFGLLFTPAFYVVARAMARREQRGSSAVVSH